MEEPKEVISSLRFLNYKVNKLLFENNDNYKGTTITINFDIKNNVKINNVKNKMEIELSTNIFEKKQNTPFYMEVSITGLFELIGEDDITKYQENAIAIMYPYLRAIVSTCTSSANVPPLILPTINVNAMLKKEKK